MMKASNILIAIFLGLFSTNALAAEEIFKDQSYYLKTLESDEILGDPEAKDLIIEYSSFSCPHCAYFHKDVFGLIKEKYIDTGRIKWINRLFINDAPSLKGSMLAKCSGKEKYYLFLKILFNKQSSWVYNKDYIDILKNISLLSGMREDTFNKCMQDEKIEEELSNQRIIATKALNIEGTPTFFLNGKIITFNNFDSFELLINEQNKS